MIGLLQPKTAVNMLLKLVKKQIGKDFKECSIIINAIEESIKFKIDGEDYEYQSDELKAIFLELGKAKLEPDENIDFLVLDTIIKGDYTLKTYIKKGDKKYLKKEILR